MDSKDKIIFTSFIPLGVDLGNGDVLSKDCVISIAPSLKNIKIENHENGVRVITECDLDSVSIVKVNDPS